MRKLARTLVALIALLAVPAGSSAQGSPTTPVLTLEEAVHTALAENPELAAAGANADAAQAEARRARAGRMPTVNLSETYHGTDSPAEVFAQLLNQERFDMDSFFAGDPNDPEWLDTWITRVEVEQPVYTGGVLGSRIDQARLSADATTLEARRAADRVALETIAAYIDLARAREQLETLLKARRTTAEHVDIARRNAEQGMILEAEVLKAQVHLAEVDEQVAWARHGAQLAEAALNYRMGVDQGVPRTLALLTAPRVPGNELDPMLADAIARRADLEAARLRAEAAEEEVDVARSGFRPEVALTGRYDLVDDQVLGTHGESGTVMGVVRFNLFRGGADRAAVDAAVHRHRAASHSVQAFEDGVRLEVRRAWQEMRTAAARLETADASVGAAREEQRVREHRFEQGLERMIDLLDADTALREARMREIVARYDLILAVYRLRLAAGAPILGS